MKTYCFHFPAILLVFVLLSVRPKVAELAFHVFTRTLHPELYTIHQSRVVKRDNYSAKIEITNCGHVITWTLAQSEGQSPLTICEAATSANQPLPVRRRVLSKPLKGSRSETVDCRSNVSYRTHFQLEPVDAEMVWMVQKQLGDGPTDGLLHRFDASGRMALGAISYVSIQTRMRSMRVQAIHTFPDDCAIVKVESLFSIDVDEPSS